MRFRSVREMTLGLAGLLLGSAASIPAQPVHPDSLVRRKLTADQRIDGVPCARSTRAPAEFHPNHRLAGCALSRAHTVGLQRFGAGTWLDFAANGTLWGAWLEEDTSVDGHVCRGDGFKQWRVRFHPNGRLASCYLRTDTVVDGVPCMAGTFLREVRGGGKTALLFDDVGRLARCQASRDATVDGRAIREWEVISRRRA